MLHVVIDMVVHSVQLRWDFDKICRSKQGGGKMEGRGRLCPDLAKVAQQFPYKTQSFPDIVTLLAFPDGVRVSVKHSTVV